MQQLTLFESRRTRPRWAGLSAFEAGYFVAAKHYASRSEIVRLANFADFSDQFVLNNLDDCDEFLRSVGDLIESADSFEAGQMFFCTRVGLGRMFTRVYFSQPEHLNAAAAAYSKLELIVRNWEIHDANR